MLRAVQWHMLAGGERKNIPKSCRHGQEVQMIHGENMVRIQIFVKTLLGQLLLSSISKVQLLTGFQHPEGVESTVKQAWYLLLFG